MNKKYEVFYLENGKVNKVESFTFHNSFNNDVDAYIAIRDTPCQVVNHLKKTSEFIVLPVYDFSK